MISDARHCIPQNRDSPWLSSGQQPTRLAVCGVQPRVVSVSVVSPADPNAQERTKPRSHISETVLFVMVIRKISSRPRPRAGGCVAQDRNPPHVVAPHSNKFRLRFIHSPSNFGCDTRNPTVVAALAWTLCYRGQLRLHQTTVPSPPLDKTPTTKTAKFHLDLQMTG